MKTVLMMLVLVFMLSAILETKLISTASAETTDGGSSTASEYLVEEERVDGVGTYFEVKNSPYLNITLTSTETVRLVLESVPRIVSFIIERNSSAASTVLTLTGFEPDTTYHRYQDGYLMESFVADTSGEYIYTQDVSQDHHVFFQEHLSTIYIGRNYTFSDDIHEMIFVTADNITIDGNGYTLQGPGSGFGIYLLFRKGVTIKNCVITGWTHAIFMYQSKFNSFINNTVVDNPGWVAVRLESSPNNTFEYNTIADSPDRGLGLWYSGSITLRYNSFTGNLYSFGIRAAKLGDYMNDIDTSNTVDGKIMYYLINQSDILIDPLTFPNAGYLGVINSINITVRGLNLTNNRDGIDFAHTMNSTIENVNVSTNLYNMILFDSHYNTIRCNTMSNGWVGIMLWYPNPWYPTPCSTHNKIYHNNFLNNTEYGQVFSWYSKNSWDDGYPSGGNYWSDYAGVDEYSGPGQDQPGSDGIGDTSYRKYVLPNIVYDQYPFMKPLGRIAGRVTDEYLPTGLVGSTVELSTGATASTGFDGYYEFPAIPIGTYTVTQTLLTDYGTHDLPTKPAEVTVGHATTINFKQFEYVAIYGYVNNSIDNTPISEVTVDLSGGAVRTYVTESDGLYTFNNVDPSSSYTITLVTSTLPSNWAVHGLDTITLDNLLARYPSDTRVNFKSYPLPLILAEKIADKIEVMPSGYVTYTICYDNIGPGPAKDVIVTDVLPPMVTYLNATPSLTSISDSTLTWNIGDVESGGSGTITLVVQTSPLSPIGEVKINTATIQYNDYYHNAQNPKSDSAETIIVESDENYGDDRTVGFWKHQVYSAITDDSGTKVSKSELLVFLEQISVSSNYPLYQSMYVAGDDWQTLLNAYSILENPTGTDSMQARAEQQLLATWLNIARHVFYSNTQLSSKRYGEYGLSTVGDAIMHCENILLNSNSSTADYEKAKTISDNLNRGKGIVW